MSDPAIEVHGLRKAYGDFEAVRGIDFEVRRGEVFGLLGPNGAGKTTTVEILEGYRDAQRRRGLACSDTTRRSASMRAAPTDRDRAAVRAASTRHITLARGARALGRLLPASRATSTRCSSLAGLEGKADVRRRKLSGGQLRRLDFALALVGDPELIFLDEPTTGFDPEARRTAWETVRSLRELGKTILLTTHYLDEAQELADRVAIVKDGRVLAIGPPRELGAGSGSADVPRRLPRRRRRAGRARDRRPDHAAARAHRAGARARAGGWRS